MISHALTYYCSHLYVTNKTVPSGKHFVLSQDWWYDENFTLVHNKYCTYVVIIPEAFFITLPVSLVPLKYKNIFVGHDMAKTGGGRGLIVLLISNITFF